MQYQVGKDLDAWCTRCRLDTTHVIVALGADGRAKRVECTSCGGQHNYRAPKTAQENAKASRGSGVVSRRAMAVAAAKEIADVTADAMPAGAAPKKKPPVVAALPSEPAPKKKRAPRRPAAPKLSATERAKVRAAVAAADLWADRLGRADLSVAREYSIRETFAVHDLIQHPRFGVGFVLRVDGAQKCEVLFEDGARVLAMAR